MLAYLKSIARIITWLFIEPFFAAQPKDDVLLGQDYDNRTALAVVSAIGLLWLFILCGLFFITPAFQLFICACGVIMSLHAYWLKNLRECLPEALGEDHEYCGPQCFRSYCHGHLLCLNNHWRWRYHVSKAQVKKEKEELLHKNVGLIRSVDVPSLRTKPIYPMVVLSLPTIEELYFVSLPPLSKQAQQHFKPQDVYFVGFGFAWKPEHSRRLHRLQTKGVEQGRFNKNGSPSIHAVAKDQACEPIFAPVHSLYGHTLIVGTTGSGKTRLLDLQISQAILRGDTVIVIDPKGDSDMKKVLYQTAKAAGRTPLSTLFCLDVGTPKSSPLTSPSTQRFAFYCEGQHRAVGTEPQSLLRDPDNQCMPYERRTYGPKSIIHHGEQDFSQAHTNSLHETEASLRAEHLGYSNVSFGTDVDLRENEHPALLFFEHMNSGFNPLSSFDVATEVASRVTAHMSESGAAASFKNYSIMAIAAAVSCLKLLHKRVTLNELRSIVAEHRTFERCFHRYLNEIVITLNIEAVTLYFTRLHGIREAKLAGNCWAVNELVGPDGDGSASQAKVKKVLAQMQSKGLVVDDDEEIENRDADPDIPELEPEDEEESATKTKKTSKSKAQPKYGAQPASLEKLARFYSWLLDKNYIAADPSISHIFEMARLPSEYYKKVTAGVLPVLSSLTEGELNSLLSSQIESFPTMYDIINGNKIFYVGLHCMKDATIGHALGQLLLSDLAATAGTLNAKNISLQHRVSVYIDEAAEVVNESLIQLLNKSRSAGFSITLATQCFADLAKRTGSSAAAEQVIANCNNLISLRVNDEVTALHITAALAHTSLVDASSSISGTGEARHVSRTKSQRDSTLFPASMLHLLPDLEFVALLANGILYKGFLPILDKSNPAEKRGKERMPPAPIVTAVAEDNIIEPVQAQKTMEQRELSVGQVISMSEIVQSLDLEKNGCEQNCTKVVTDAALEEQAYDESHLRTYQQFHKAIQEPRSKEHVEQQGDHDIFHKEWTDSDFLPPAGEESAVLKEAKEACVPPLMLHYKAYKQEHKERKQQDVTSSFWLWPWLFCLRCYFSTTTAAVVTAVLIAVLLSGINYCVGLSRIGGWLSLADPVTALIKSGNDILQYCHDVAAACVYAWQEGDFTLNQDLTINSTFFHRCAQVFDWVVDYAYILISCAVIGMYYGHSVCLQSESEHLSLIGLHSMINVWSLPSLILIVLTVASLYSSFLFCVEWTFIVCCAYSFLFGFTTACFYSLSAK